MPADTKPQQEATDLSEMEDPAPEPVKEEEQPTAPPEAVKPPEHKPDGQPDLKDVPEPPVPFDAVAQLIAKDDHAFKREDRVKVFAPEFDIDGLYGMIASNSHINRKVACQDGQERSYRVWDVELDTRIEGLFQLPARMLIPCKKYIAILR